MENVIEDERFSHIARDPRFKRVPKNDRKVKIDKRFQSMFTDDKFKVKYAVDKRGRPINYSSSENLRKYYSLSSEDEDSSEEEGASSEHEEETPTKGSSNIPETTEKLEEDQNESETDPHYSKSQSAGKSKRNSKSKRTSSGFTVEDISEDENINMNTKVKDPKLPDHVKEKLRNLDIDYARGEGVIFSDSSSDEESSDDSVAEFEEMMAHEWGELDKDAGTTDTSTYRLAVCNMDWDRIRAKDLMVLFSSFTPKEGFIKSVAVYPSEFGKQRMKEEEVKGPTELTSQENKEDVDDAEEGSSFHMEKLRKYQLNRLKYFFGVVECDSVTTADKLYAECDGLEYESSAIRLDLRFIPDDMNFDEEPREICTNIPDATKYQPRHFINKALQQAKVECTWDETNPDRVELTEKIMKSNGDVDDEDIRAYLASSSDESEEGEVVNDAEEIDGDGEDHIAKYRALVKSIQEKEKAKSERDVEMEVTWGIGLKEKTEKLVKEKLKGQKEDLTPFEKYLEKRKEKKKLKKKEKKAKEEDQEIFSDDDIPSDVDLNDPYFKEELEKMNDGNKKGKKSKKIQKDENESSEDEARKKTRDQLELLVMDNETKNHFNINAIMKQENRAGKKKKRKGKKHEDEEVIEDNFQINVKDPRFEALYSSHHFNIDPADPHFRKTKAMDALFSEKLNRRTNENKEDLNAPSKLESNQKSDPELSVLVKSVKRKTEKMYANKKKMKTN